MKKLAVLLIMLLVPSVLHAAASSETGDTRAEPISLYGKQSDGTVTALQVDSDGKLVTSGGSGDSVWTADDVTDSVNLTTDYVGYTLALDGDLIAEKDLTVYGAAYFEGIGEGTIQIADDLTVYHNLTVSQVPELFLDGVQKTGIFYSGSNVGIGVSSPLSALEVEGGIIIDDYIQAQDASGLVFKTDEGTTRMVVDDAGNVGIGTAAPGSKLDVQGDATVATDMTVGNNLSVGNTISAGSLEVAGVSAGSLTVGDEIILTPANTVQINGDLTTSGFIRQDSTFIDLPLDFDLSRSNGIGSTIEYLYGSFTPYNFNVETATLFIDLTPSGDLTVAIYEGAADVTTPDVDISATKVGTSHTVNNLFESGNFLGVKLTGVSDSTDLTNTGVLRLLGERRSES